MCAKFGQLSGTGMLISWQEEEQEQDEVDEDEDDNENWENQEVQQHSHIPIDVFSEQLN